MVLSGLRSLLDSGFELFQFLADLPEGGLTSQHFIQSNGPSAALASGLKNELPFASKTHPFRFLDLRHGVRPCAKYCGIADFTKETRDFHLDSGVNLDIGSFQHTNERVCFLAKPLSQHSLIAKSRQSPARAKPHIGIRGPSVQRQYRIRIILSAISLYGI